jgi:hypothetical protein
MKLRAEYRRMYRTARKQFDKSLRRAKRLYQLNKQNELLQLSNSDSKSFWKKIGRIGIAEDRNKNIPWEVKRGNGSVTRDKSEVLNEWKDYYADLLQSSDSADYNNEFRDVIAQRLLNNDVPGPTLEPHCMNMNVTMKEVEMAVNNLKKGKAAGLDNIPAEVLKNPTCVSILHQIIDFCFHNSVSPAEWRKGLLSPILKPGGEPTDTQAYRGITLLSIPCKVYADILNRRLQNWLEETNGLSEEQNGFRRQRGCAEHIYSICNLINTRKSQRKSTFVCFVDIRKAFDKVDRTCLWYKLMQAGVRGKIISGIQGGELRSKN